MAFAEVSCGGWVTFGIISGIIGIVLSSISSDVSWWLVWFGDCIYGDGWEITMSLESHCIEEDETRTIGSLQGTCQDFTDLRDEFGDDADVFIHASRMFYTTDVIIFMTTISFFAQLCLKNDVWKGYLRVASVYGIVLSFVFLFIILVTTPSTEITDPSSEYYEGLMEDCNSEASIPGLAWIFSLIIMLVLPCLGLCVASPCCCCVAETKHDDTTPLRSANHIEMSDANVIKH